MLRPTDLVVPTHHAMGEFETPMRPSALGLPDRCVPHRTELQRCPVVDGRQTAAELPFAPPLDLIGRFIAWIERPKLLKPFGGLIIALNRLD